MKEIKEHILIVILPLLLLVTEFCFSKYYQYFYMSVADPVYAYLFNGLNLAIGEWELGHTDHPGTPLQILVALIIRIAYFFRKTDLDIIADVLSNPELYLGLTSHLLILLNISVLWFSGSLILKKTNSVRKAIFFQSAIFLFPTIFLKLSMVMAEAFYPAIMMMLITWIVLHLISRSNNSGHTFKYPLVYGVFTGLALATKILLFPVIIIPLLIIRSWKGKISYLLISMISFIVFILPAINKMQRFIQWFLRILFHKGVYGTGESGFDLSAHVNNIKLIAENNLMYVFFYFLLLIFLVFIVSGKISKKIRNKSYFRVFTGLLVFHTLLILLVSKQYSDHYLIAGYLFIPLTAYIVYQLIQQEYPGLFSKFKENNRNFLLIVFIGFNLANVLIKVDIASWSNNPLKETIKYSTENIKSQPRIIVSSGAFDSPFKESGLYFGLSYSGKLKSRYAAMLKKLYPDTYFYFNRQNLLNDWSSLYFAEDIFRKYDSVFVYVKDRDSLLIRNLSDKFIHLGESSGIKIIQQDYYKNQQSKESLYKFKCIDRIDDRNVKHIERTYCNCEEKDSSGQFLTGSEGCFVSKAFLQTDESSFRGTYSVKLSPEEPYGLDMFFKVNPGDQFRLSVWRKSSQGEGVFVFTSFPDKSFYEAGGAVQKYLGEWGKIEFNVEVPESYSGDSCHIYFWNQLQKNTIYLDDLEIERSPKN
ncbi:MAG: hypothetical protein JXJ22_03565 [Bacteroidales bacterium]|nr:hypothetical protein [Bacteroidales bacterium]